MNRPGIGPQPLRQIPNSLYQNQQGNIGRTGLLPSNRLQNGKLGWSFGAPPGGAPGTSGNHPRTNNGVLSGFAQGIGSSQPHTPLDPSEFPSLSGNSQSQLQNTNAQALWSNPSIRAPQHNPVQRPQPQVGNSHPQPTALQSSRNQSQSHEESGNNSNKFASDEYRFTGLSNVGQMTGTSQQQAGDVDDFPPLGGNGPGDMAQDRLSSLVQGGTFAPGEIATLGQSNNRLSSPGDRLQERSIPNVSGRSLHSMPGLRPGLDGIRVSQANQAEDDRSTSNLPSRNGGSGQQISDPQQPSQIAFSTGEVFSDPAIELGTGLLQQGEPNISIDIPDSSARPARSRTLSNMTDADRWSLQGLLEIIPQEASDHSSIAVGQDLTVLGLDLNRPDNSPLYPTFGSPFVEANARPIIPDFRLPAAYTVSNVPLLHSKIQNFSDETLFMIFYQFPRDILQEFAAAELYARNWRWHKTLRQWLTQDKMSGSPQHLSRQGERGWYVFFDVNGWRRERRQFELNYDDLDQRHAGGSIVSTQ